MPQFEFINVGRPGDEKKQSSKIRRHVMKDIGRSRRKPKKCDEAVSKSILEATPAPNSYSQALVPNPLVECKLSDIVFPVRMDEERRNLAEYVFAQARTSYHPFRIPWLSISLSDAAAWYITLANAVIMRRMKPDDPKPDFNTDTEATKWYTLSLESISKRLADPKERKEGLIGAITGFICHDSAAGNFARQEIHLRGLKRLVDSIGGIDEITNPMLRLMISWHDLTGASYRNTLPYFEVPKGSLTNIDTKNDTIYFKMLLDSWDKKCPYLGDIYSALTATAAVASYVNQHCQTLNFWTDDVTAARLLAPALHEVLSLEGRALASSPLHPGYSGTAAREAFRRSLLIFLASLKAKFGAAKFELKRHLDDFRQISRIPHVDWALIPELNLWAHTIAALEEESDQRSWHVSAITSIMESTGFASSQQVLGVVRDIIWVEALFMEKVEALSHEIDSLVASKIIHRRLRTPKAHGPGTLY
ncbi:hypothetical protein GQX73_g578 [Xylaria multiplex]|uniref:Tachykinin family protein n=1 Tax=Xylaria multiplex TaxID=323545 RepID=A0A7C8MW79_9PEZI|nr:hypothetical protein GQX73_g578 [Xylaria multiplex]